MLRISRPTDFRRKAAGIGVIGSFAALVAQDVVEPENSGNPAEMLRLASDHGGEFFAAALLLLVSTILLVPGIYGLVHLVRERGVKLAHIGGVFAVLGALGHMAYVTYALFVLEMADGDRAQMVALLERMDSGGAAVVFPLILSFAVALLLLAVALYRAGYMPRWGLVAVIAAVLIDVAAPGGAVVGLAKQLLAGAAFAPVGLQMLRMSNAEWEHPSPRPTAKGSQAVAEPATA